MTLDKLEIFCVTDKKIPHIEKTNYKIAAVGKDNFPDSYLRCDTLENIFYKERKVMPQFKNITVEKKANIYFEGKVISRKIIFSDGSIKTLGVMLPGEYEFKTNSKELMEITSGKLEYQLLNNTDWITITDGMNFSVPNNSSFKVKIRQIVDYCCSYID